MKDCDEFKCEYEVEDGYVGPSRPHYFEVWASEIHEDMTENELDSLFEDRMQEAFEQKLSPYGNNKEDFIEWALEVVKTLKEENKDEDSDGICFK